MPLNDPVPSSAADVIKRDAQDFDRFVVGAANTFVNRLGATRLTVEGIIADASTRVDDAILTAVTGGLYVPVGDFGTEFTINERREVGFDGSVYWRWNGALPHTVLATDTPSSPAWTDVTQATLGADLINPAQSANRVARMPITADSLKDLVNAPKIDGRQYSVKGFYAGADVGGGLFYWDSSRDKTEHNGGTIIDPDRIGVWDGTQADLATLFTAAVSGSGCFVRTEASPSSVTITVGPTAQLPTINKAIEYLKVIKNRFPIVNNFTISIQSDFVMSEQVIVIGEILDWITITTNGNQITYNNNSLTIPLVAVSETPLFGAGNFAVLPKLVNAKFVSDGSDSGNTGKTGIYVRQNSKAYLFDVTVDGASGSGLLAEYLSDVDARGCGFPNSGVWGIAARHGSKINGRDSTTNTEWDLTGCGSAAIYCLHPTSSLYMRYADTRGSVDSVVFDDMCSVSVNTIKADKKIKGSRGARFNFSEIEFFDPDGIFDLSSGAVCVGQTVTHSSADTDNATVTATNAIYCNNADLKITGSCSLRFLDKATEPVSSVTNGIYAENGANVYISNYTAPNALQYGIYSVRSNVDCPSCDISSSGSMGVFSSTSSNVNVANSNITECGTHGVRAYYGSTVNARLSNCRVGVSDSGNDIRVTDGAIIYANGATGGVFQTANTPTANGIIFQ